MKTTCKKFSYFVGVDVSKNELDYAVIHNGQFIIHREIQNTIPEIESLLVYLKTLPKFMCTKAIFCMESTGVYGNHLLAVLKKNKINVVVENPFRLKHSLGLVRGKNDKTDAIRIVNYTYANKEKLYLWISRSAFIEQLTILAAARNRLLKVKLVLAVPLKEQAKFAKRGTKIIARNLCKDSIASIEADIQAVDRAMVELVATNTNLLNLIKIITSVPCVGFLTAVHVIIATNEFKLIDSAKKFACYAGVAPFRHESGVFKGKTKVSHLANKKMKSLLHICAMNAVRCSPELKEYYKRRVAEGKHKMCVLNAVRNKIIARIFTCIHQNRLYQKDFLCRNQLFERKNVPMAMV